MKKLEKLNQDKFKAFEGEKISNLAKLVGGTTYSTCFVGDLGALHKDGIDTTTYNGWLWVGVGPIDFYQLSGVATEGSSLGNVTKGTTSIAIYNNVG